MKECLIVGAGSSKAKAVEYTDIFSISANLHHPNANIIFAQDDPIMDCILREGIDGFRTQPVFTTPQKYKKYKITLGVMSLIIDFFIVVLVYRLV